MTVFDKIEIVEHLIDDYPADGNGFENWMASCIRSLREVFGHGEFVKSLQQVLDHFHNMVVNSPYTHTASSRLATARHNGGNANQVLQKGLQQLYNQEDAIYCEKPSYPVALKNVHRKLREQKEDLEDGPDELAHRLNTVASLVNSIKYINGIDADHFSSLENIWTDILRKNDPTELRSGRKQIPEQALLNLKKVFSLLRTEIRSKIKACNELPFSTNKDEYERRRSESTSEIKSLPEIKEKMLVYKSLRSKTKTAYKKYSKAVQNFYFLNVIVMPKIGMADEDFLLETAISNLFNSIGITSQVPANKDNFDVISKFKEITLGIEVKNGNLPGENEMLQALKYKGRQLGTHHAVVIWNNATTNQEFDANRIYDANTHKYGIMTTKQLKLGYMKLKNGKITFENFLSQVQRNGLIKFSARALKEGL